MNQIQIRAMSEYMVQQSQAGYTVPPGSYGKLLLSNGMTLTGTWTSYEHVLIANLTDDAGAEWWVDLSHVIAFCPQPKPV